MIAELIKNLKEDPELYYGYQANIAMAFSDVCCNYKKKHKKKALSTADIHICANTAAINFLSILINSGE